MLSIRTGIVRVSAWVKQLALSSSKKVADRRLDRSRSCRNQLRLRHDLHTFCPFLDLFVLFARLVRESRASLLS